MKKCIRILLAFSLSLCCLFSGLPFLASAATSAGSTGDMVSASANADEIYQFLVYEMGLNSAAACGILANIQRESNFNPDSLGDSDTSYGICQWHDSAPGSGRYTNLIKWCQKNGYDYTSLDGQLHFLQYELSQNNSSVLYNGLTIYQALLAVSNDADGAYEAGYYWCDNFERPYANYPAKRIAECEARGTLARDTYWISYSQPLSEGAFPVSGGMQVNWTKTKGASRYELYRYTSGDASTLKLIASTTDTQALDSSVKSGNTYTYYLCAIIPNANGTSSSIKSQEFTQYYLTPPTITKCTGSSTGQTITWKKKKGVSRYIICRSSGGSDYMQIAETSATSYKDTTATTPNVRYSYQIYACYESPTGEVTYSLSSNAIGNYALAAPVINSVSATAKGVRIKWNSTAKATGYTVYRSVDGGSYEKIASVTKTAYTDTGAAYNTSVRYKIYARYTGASGQTGKSAASSAVGITYLKRPTIKTVTAGSKSLTLKWSRNKKATGYEIQYSTSSSFPSGSKKLLIVTNDTTSWKIKSLKKSTTYYVRIRTYVTNGKKKSYSAWSDAFQCKTK